MEERIQEINRYLMGWHPSGGYAKCLKSDGYVDSKEIANVSLEAMEEPENQGQKAYIFRRA
jgi:hypothetical protein